MAKLFVNDDEMTPKLRCDEMAQALKNLPVSKNCLYSCF